MVTKHKQKSGLLGFDHMRSSDCHNDFGQMLLYTVKHGSACTMKHVGAHQEMGCQRAQCYLCVEVSFSSR